MVRSVTVPVITIDGPSGSGKGTISQMLAAKLGFHYLDSGALYRLLGLAARRHHVSLESTESLSVLAAHMDITFRTGSDGALTKVLLEGENVSGLIRTEEAGGRCFCCSGLSGGASRTAGTSESVRTDTGACRRWARYGYSGVPRSLLQNISYRQRR